MVTIRMDIDTPVAKECLAKNYKFSRIKKDERTNKTFIYFDTVATELTPSQELSVREHRADDDNKIDTSIRRRRFKHWDSIDNIKSAASKENNMEESTIRRKRPPPVRLIVRRNSFTSTREINRVPDQSNFVQRRAGRKKSTTKKSPDEDITKETFLKHLHAKKSNGQGEKLRRQAQLQMMFSNALDVPFSSIEARQSRGLRLRHRSKSFDL